MRKYNKNVVYSLIFGTIIALSTFLEFVVGKYATINDIILDIPRLIADIIFECELCPSMLIFIPIITLIFYTILAFLVFYLIEKLRNKK